MVLLPWTAMEILMIYTYISSPVPKANNIMPWNSLGVLKDTIVPA